MKLMIKCANCGRMVPANPRVKNQTYCNRKTCQRVRKNKWKQNKMASDPDYKNDQRDYHKRLIKQEHFICISLNGANEVINTRVVQWVWSIKPRYTPTKSLPIP